MYNNQVPVPLKIDWENFDLILLNKRELDIDESYINIYVDLEYMNDQIIAIKGADKDRQQESPFA